MPPPPTASSNSGGDYVTNAYPADERLRQKAKLKAGHVPKARKQVVEDHYGDCGTDLAGLAPYLQTAMLTVGDDDPADYDDDDLTSGLTSGLATWWLLGSSAPAGLGPQGENVWLVSTIHAFLNFLTSLDDGIDIVEVCGGEARPSTLALRRPYKVEVLADLDV